MEKKKKSLGPAAALYIWRRQRSSLNRSGSPFPEVQTHGCLCGPGLETSNIIACRGTLSEIGEMAIGGKRRDLKRFAEI